MSQKFAIGDRIKLIDDVNLLRAAGISSSPRSKGWVICTENDVSAEYVVEMDEGKETWCVDSTLIVQDIAQTAAARPQAKKVSDIDFSDWVDEYYD